MKRIRIVAADSTGAEAYFGDNLTGPERRRAKGAAILNLLEEELQGGEEQLALSTVAIRLRARLRDSGQDYDGILESTRGKLIDLIRTDDRFSLEERGTGVQSRYFVRLA